MAVDNQRMGPSCGWAPPDDAADTGGTRRQTACDPAGGFQMGIGKSVPDTGTLLTMAELFGVSVETVLSGEEAVPSVAGAKRK